VQLPSPPMPPPAQLVALLAHAPRQPGGQRSTRTAEAAREAKNGRSRKKCARTIRQQALGWGQGHYEEARAAASANLRLRVSEFVLQ
jgi:hypothetical protein